MLLKPTKRMWDVIEVFREVNNQNFYARVVYVRLLARKLNTSNSNASKLLARCRDAGIVANVMYDRWALTPKWNEVLDR